MDRQKLEGLTREELVSLASELGIVRPRSLTVPELLDEIITRTASNEREKARSRGWLGRARTLLASVIERGLHLPDVAKALRNTPASRPWPSAPAPLATMTLAEIYATQGHLDKALQVLDEILVREPEHADARSLRQRLDAQLNARKRPEFVPNRRDTAEDVQVPNTPSAALEGDVNVTPIATDEAAQAPVEAPLAFVSPDADLAPALEVPEVPETKEAPTQTSDIADQPEATAVPTDVPEDLPELPEVPSNVDELAEALPVEEAPVAAVVIDRPDIEELPLPERYNVDEIVGIAVDPTAVYLYWEVRPVVLARAHARLPEGKLVVRLVSVTPSWDGPIVEHRDLPIDALYGDAYVRNLRPGSNVRISVGWLAHGVFAPFAIGEAVVTSRKEPSFAIASTVARWTPDLPAVPRQTHDDSVAQLLELASRPPAETSVGAEQGSFTFERGERVPERWPTFDLGQRGLTATGQERVQDRSQVVVGGSSDLSLGGASDLVQPVGRMDD